MFRILNPNPTARSTLTLGGGRVASFDPVTGLCDVDLETDAGLAGANGMIVLGQVGTTAQRPTPSRVGQRYLDLTLGYEIVADGIRGNWRSPASGAVV